MKRYLIAMMILVFGSTAQAQMVTDCDWRTSAENLLEPWQDNTRQFSNGKVRLAVLDTTEPAAGSFHLMILSPPYSVFENPQCKLVTMDETVGFSDIQFGGLRAGYDPAYGLLFNIPIRRFIPNRDTFADGLLRITLNQATGLIKVDIE